MYQSYFTEYPQNTPPHSVRGTTYSTKERNPPRKSPPRANSYKSISNSETHTKNVFVFISFFFCIRSNPNRHYAPQRASKTPQAVSPTKNQTLEVVDDPHHDRIAGYVVTAATAVRRGVQRVVPLAPSPGTPQAANHAPDSAHRRHGPAEDPLQHAGPGCAANRGLLLLPVIDYLSQGARRPARCGLAISYYT